MSERLPRVKRRTSKDMMEIMNDRNKSASAMILSQLPTEVSEN
ncbi:MAG: hypothetical protein V3V22_06225 [Methylococcales bacterium]